MAVLCKLADPAGYRAFDWDLLADPEDFDYWVGLFETFPGNIERRLREDGLAGEDFENRWAAFRAAYDAGIARLRRDPTPELTTIALGEFRQQMLNGYGWPDPYRELKRRENAVAVEMYPDVIARIDACHRAQRWEALLCGLFAGNMFDMGAPETIAMHERGEIDFATLLARIPPRPWCIDHADTLCARLDGRRYRQVLFFVDNAGCDVVLGAVPLMREMARRGMRVVAAANSTAALNDITHDELVDLLESLARVDEELARMLGGGRMATVESGSGSPLIDLSRISAPCNNAAAASDLIVLEGMGRGVESNWRQRFTCDVARIALVKDACVAKWLGCEMFQPVCRFDPAPG